VQSIQRSVNQGQFLLNVGDRLSVAVRLNNVGAQQLKKKLVVVAEVFTLTAERVELISHHQAGDL